MIISTYNPYKINEIGDFFYSYGIFEIRSLFSTYGTSSLRLATFRVLNSHTWPVATVLNSTVFVYAPKQSKIVGTSQKVRFRIPKGKSWESSGEIR